ncbi:hypothetical protein Zmor_024426 [Zophobas morio]|uniref:Uncharacterized protein n=1 Tax=Zophobas morio TaxID=2755281 RepID=A0AA38I070_9CUCU|nr:hypothetical protein Zmor_024426 [Zophobas morio]
MFVYEICGPQSPRYSPDPFMSIAPLWIAAKKQTLQIPTNRQPPFQTRAKLPAVPLVALAAPHAHDLNVTAVKEINKKRARGKAKGSRAAA